MIDSFNQYYDKITNLSAPGYQDSEILLFLNNGKDEFVKERVFGKNFQPPAFEDSQKRVADIRPIMRRELLVSDPENAVFDYEYRFDLTDLSETMQYFLSAQAVINRSAYPATTGSRLFECDFVDFDEWHKFHGNLTINKMVLHKIPLTIDGDTVRIIVDYWSGRPGLYLSYTTPPSAIAASDAEYTSLAVHAHQEIVDIAVRQAMQAAQDQRWQTQVAEVEQIKSR